MIRRVLTAGVLATLLALRAVSATAEEAFAAKQAGDYPRAIALYQELIAAEPADPAHFFQLGTVQGWAGHYDDALATLKRGLALAPADIDMKLALGRVLAWAGQLAQAESVFREVLSTQPGNLDARNMLGRVLSWRRQFTAAEEEFDRILVDAPANTDALIGRGDVEKYQQRFDDARRYYERAAVTDPTSRDIQRLLASVRRAGRWRLDAGVEFSTFDDHARSDWSGGDAALRYAVNKRTGVSLGAEWAERFDLRDSQYTLGADRRFSDSLAGYARLSATPSADFFAKHMIAAGGTWRARQGDARLPATTLLADYRTATYGPGTAHSLWLGVSQDTTHRMAVTAKWLATRNLNDHWTNGWLVQLEGEPADDWRWQLGYADSTESLASTVFDFTLAQRTRALFAGVYHEFSPAFGLRLDVTREWSTVDRKAVHAGLTTRF